MYGAGNIGRGFIGALLSQCGYDVVFIDVNPQVVEALNAQGGYIQEIVGETPRENWISGVRAVSGMDEEKVVREIASADLMATALGAAVLPKVVPLIARGLEARWQKNPDDVLDILICENLMNADQFLRKLLKKELAEPYQSLMDRSLGLVETSIGRMVPIMTPAMQKGDILRICVEAYDYLPVDRAALKGKLPDYPKLIAYTPFGFYLERKLYIHNMAHAMTAYLGQLMGKEYIYEAIGNMTIRNFVENAMAESALAIGKKYGEPYEKLAPHIQDLLYRFSNRALGDTVTRVSRDPVRKLQPEDRLVGAARNGQAQGGEIQYLALAIAACVSVQAKKTGTEPQSIITSVCQIDAAEPLGKNVLHFTKLLTQDTIDWQKIAENVDAMGHTGRGMIP
ncbi:MAG: mannitol dehydrogenase [Eubacteriaceae bacterium]|jgi:mannitol-1-phosphate 5-dehydrogenase|nr:mannitol dehydrogenase [Eubacteriaceae bacterium]MDD4508779.1 mannitol dehydrogenase [Eubacteriaceae bacterium]